MSPSAEAFESLACRLRGVYACHVVMDAGRAAPARVEVTADISRRTAAARDVQSAFYAAFDVLVPLERIAVTIVRRPAGSGPPASDGGRLILTGVRYEDIAGRLRVRVTLRQHDQEAAGVAEAAGAADRLRAGAEAALAAMAAARGWPPAVSLEEVAVIHTGPHQAVLVRLRVGAGEHDLNLGVALVRHDGCEAAVRATLAAMNRLEPGGGFAGGGVAGEGSARA